MNPFILSFDLQTLKKNINWQRSALKYNSDTDYVSFSMWKIRKKYLRKYLKQPKITCNPRRILLTMLLASLVSHVFRERYSQGMSQDSDALLWYSVFFFMFFLAFSQAENR